MTPPGVVADRSARGMRVDVPLVDPYSAVLLLLSGLFLTGTAVHARRRAGTSPTSRVR